MAAFRRRFLFGGRSEISLRSPRPASLYALAIGAGVLLGVSGGGAWLALTRHADADTVNGLVVAPERLDFGETWAQESFTWTLPVRNPTGRDLQIVEIDSDCSCTKIEPTSLTIPAGGTRPIRLTLDLRPKRADDSKRPVRDFEVTIIPRVREYLPNSRVWTVRGTVRSAFSCSTDAVHFGEALVQGEPFPSETFQIDSHVPLADLMAECDPDQAACRVERDAEHPGRFQVVVEPASALPLGDVRFDVVLHAIRAGGEALPPIPIPCTGRVVPDVRLSPSLLAWGAQAIGDEPQEVVLIQSRSGKPFQVESVDATHESLGIEPCEVNGSGEQAYRVSCRVAAGPQRASVSFRVRDPQGQLRDLSLLVTAEGVSGTAADPRGEINHSAGSSPK